MVCDRSADAGGPCSFSQSLLRAGAPPAAASGPASGEPFGLIEGKRLRVSPWIIGADIPEVPFEVTTSEAPTSVIFILDLQDDFGAGGLRPLVDQIGV